MASIQLQETHFFFASIETVGLFLDLLRMSVKSDKSVTAGQRKWTFVRNN